MKGFDANGNALPVIDGPQPENPGNQMPNPPETEDAIRRREAGYMEPQQFIPTGETERKPMVCRMVLFHTTEHDQKIYSQPAVLPAVVTFVNPDGSVNLTIFSDSHDNSYQKNVMQGPAPGQWDWPQY